MVIVLNENISNKELAEELRKPIIRNFKKRKVHSSFTDDIWGADLTDMQLISKFYKGFRFLVCVFYIFSKYAWTISLKDKKCVTITNAFQNILKEPDHKPNRIDKGLIKTVNLPINQRNHFWRIIT